MPLLLLTPLALDTGLLFITRERANRPISIGARNGVAHRLVLAGLLRA